MDIREDIAEIEDSLCSELDLERVGVGYDALCGYLNERKALNKPVRKQLHEYRVFLTVLRLWVDSADVDSDDRIHFSPSRGKDKGRQSEAAPSIFIEPALPVYLENELWDTYQSEFHYLKKPGGDGPKRHTKPDMLLTKDGVGKLPWAARVDNPVVDESKLMSLCAHEEYEEVADEIGTNDVPSNATECFRLVQNRDKREDPSELYEKWEEFKHNAEYIIESKHEPLTEEDYSQILWYALAYKTDIILVSGYPVTDLFIKDADKLPVEISIVDGFDVGVSPTEAVNKLSDGLNS